MLDKKTYDLLKFVAQVALPAVGTLYFAVAGIWGLPNPEGVVGTIVAVDTFLGVLLHASTKKWRKKSYGGEIVKGGEKARFALEKHPDELKTGQEVLFDVVDKPREEET